jgi:cell division septum initiation protein DivIVA
MTKQQELAAFNAFIETLPQNTYLRPWLDSIKYDVERDVRCDMFIEHTPISWAESVRKQAQDESQRITDAAHREAAAIIEKARLKGEEVTQKRLRLYNELQRMAKELY